MVSDLVAIIKSYACEEGFTVYGNRLARKFRYYDLSISPLHITVYMNGEIKPFYRIETFKDVINFCLIISSIEDMQKYNMPCL
jgi:hypothetical protein